MSSNPVDRLLSPAPPFQGADIADIADILHPKCVSPVPQPTEVVEQGKGAGEIGRGEVRNVSEVRIVQPLTERTELTEIAASIANTDNPVALDIETYGENALNPYSGPNWVPVFPPLTPVTCGCAG